MTKLLSLAVVASLAVSAQAKSRKPVGPDQSEKAAQTVATAVGAMRDSAGISEELMNALEKKNVSVQIREKQDAVAEDYEIAADIPLRFISVQEAAAAQMSHRHLGAHIAEQAAIIAYEDMPDCAERDFMVLSAMSRSWMELFGRRSELPMFDGVKDEKLAAKIQDWASTNMEGYVRESKKPGLQAMIDQLHADLKQSQAHAKDEISAAEQELADPADIEMFRTALKLVELQAGKKEKELKAAQAQAKAFADEETEWFMKNQHLTGN